MSFPLGLHLGTVSRIAGFVFLINVLGGSTLGQTLMGFTPITPCRIMDTRVAGNFQGTFGPPTFTAGETRRIPVANSVCGLPSESRAYALNVTLVPTGSAVQKVTIWPAGQTQPATTTISNPNQRVIAQNAIIAADGTGAIDVFTSGPTDLLIDITGYFSGASSGLAFYPITPCRIADTRNANGQLGGPALAANTPRAFPVLQSGCGIPAAARAYALNITVVPTGSALGFLTVYPAGTTRPKASTLNDLDGRVLANGGIFAAGQSGSLDFFATDATHAILDISGYFAPVGGAGGLLLNTMNPCRIAVNGETLAGGVTKSLVVPSGCGGGTTSKAYAFTATLEPTSPIGYLSVWATGLTWPGVSLQNAWQAQVVGNGGVVPAGTSGAVDAKIDTGGGTLYIDITGRFVDAPNSGGAIPATVTSPMPGSSLPGPSVTFSWTPGPVSYYYFLVGTSPGSGSISTMVRTSESATVPAFPAGFSTIYVTLYWWTGSNWSTPKSYTYIPYTSLAAPTGFSPAPGSVVTSGSVISWNPNANVTTTLVNCGSQAGGSNIASGSVPGSSLRLGQIPAGAAVYCQVSFQPPGSATGAVSTTVAYRSAPAQVLDAPATFASPASGAIINPGNNIISWNAPATAVNGYELYVGTTPTGNDLVKATGLPAGVTNYSVNVPITVGRIWATLVTNRTDGDMRSAAIYDVNNLNPTSASPSPDAAQITAIHLSYSKQAAIIRWTPGNNASLYWLKVGTGLGKSDLGNSRNIGTSATEETIYNVPPSGTLYATVYTLIENEWYSTSTSLPVSVPGLQSQIPQAFRTCIAQSGTAAVPKVCTLSAGTYFFGPSDHAPLVVGGDYLTIRTEGYVPYQGAKAIFARRDAPHLKLTVPPNMPDGCGDIMTISGRHHVTIEEVGFDGGGLAFARNCISDLSVPRDQPFLKELSIEGSTAAETHSILVNRVSFRNAIGRSIEISGSNQSNGAPTLSKRISAVTIQNSEIVEAQLTGILVHWNFAYKQWEAASPTANGCDATGATASAAMVPDGVVIQWNVFQNSWTGAVALNQGVNTTVYQNTFIDNYTENSWDGGGGTMLEAECTESSDWNDNTFDNYGVQVGVFTPVFEFYGQGREIKHTKIRNNRMYGQQREGIQLSSTKYVDVTNNWIENASRADSVDYNWLFPDLPGGIFDAPGIRIENIGGWRGSDNVFVSGNTITNVDVYDPVDGSLVHKASRMDWGIRAGGCVFWDGSDCGTRGFTNISVQSNAISNVLDGQSCQLTPERFDPALTWGVCLP